MVTRVQQNPIKSFKLEFEDAPVTAWGGMALVERLASRLGLFKLLERTLPRRAGCTHQWAGTIKAVIAGLLTGSRGTFAAEPVREDPALRRLLGLGAVAEEASVWRMLGPMGEEGIGTLVDGALAAWARRILAGAPRPSLLHEGFVPLFCDGSLLEGSRRREGTKYMEGKGPGLLWTAVFAGPVLAAQRLCEPGRGENATLRDLLPRVLESVIDPLKLRDRALVLADSLHGDGPTLDELEGRKLLYVVGAGKLSRAGAVLHEMAESQWEDTGANRNLRWEASGVCACWIQCEDWPHKRLLVGRRYRREGEFIWNVRGVMTNLSERDLAPMMRRGGLSLARAVWRLYDHKGACETYFTEALEDLGLHHPPCRELKRNQAFYSVASLALALGRAADLIGGRDPERGSTRRKDGAELKRPRPRSMRLWRLRRTLLALPARVTTHARTARIVILGATPRARAMFERYWLCVCRC